MDRKVIDFSAYRFEKEMRSEGYKVVKENEKIKMLLKIKKKTQFDQTIK